MKKLFLLKKPEVFQGRKYLKSKKNYFEGWYFKNTNSKDGISFIPGISITNSIEKAFIQIITNNYSYFIGDKVFVFGKTKGFVVSPKVKDYGDKIVSAKGLFGTIGLSLLQEGGWYGKKLYNYP